jgi:hypothetical protein
MNQTSGAMGTSIHGVLLLEKCEALSSAEARDLREPGSPNARELVAIALMFTVRANGGPRRVARLVVAASKAAINNQRAQSRTRGSAPASHTSISIVRDAQLLQGTG